MERSIEDVAKNWSELPNLEHKEKFFFLRSKSFSGKEGREKKNSFVVNFRENYRTTLSRSDFGELSLFRF